MRTRLWLLAPLAGLLVACTDQNDGPAGPWAPASAIAGTAARADRAVLANQHRCPEPGFTCSVLRVPLDASGRAPGTLDLAVAAADNNTATKGVLLLLLLLTGRPGQAGVPFIERLRPRLAPVLEDYRLVAMDQRGTGANALDCPALQAQMGSSDLIPPSAGAVMACATVLGDRPRFYSTADTVRDIEALRSALAADKLTLDGVSYGTYVAEHYALRYPGRVRRLVLDSVLPHDYDDALQLTNLRATADVLRAACKEQRCTTDPAQDLAALVGSRHDGPALLNMLVTLSIVSPAYAELPDVLAEARAGRPDRLDSLLADVKGQSAASASSLSQGLHASTVCADLPVPWGDSSTPAAAREPALAQARARLSSDDTWPFDAATAVGNGLVETCRYWPPTAPSAVPPRGPLPPVPVLLLAGDRDLSTPVAGARIELEQAPQGRLVIVPGAGHSVQSRSANPAGLEAVLEFLAD